MAQFKVKGVKTRLVVSGSGDIPAELRPARPAGRNAAAVGVPGGDNNPDRAARATALDPAQRRVDREPHVPKWQGILEPYNKLGDHFYEGAIDPATRIIHQTADKVHRLSGAARYTTTGEEISISQEVGIIVLGTNTDWTQNGTLRYVTTHDRNNDDRS